jgi:sigma-B regulation protein RsbU (phosphoserine phosphatase)
MTVRRKLIPFRLLVRRSVRYLLVKRGFRLVEAVVVLAALAFVLTGSRIAAIDRLGNRADIVASVVVTSLAIVLLRAVNRRVVVAIDRRFFREAYNAQVILTELGEAVRTYTKIEQLLELVAASITAALHPENVKVSLEDEATGELFAAFSSDDASAGDAAPTRPALVIPIKSNGHLYGAISLGGRLGDLPYSKEDEQLLHVVAGQMAIVLENASLIRRMAEEERIKRELEMAAEVQRRLFPAGEYKDAALELYGTCIPARWVGGDYYDYFAVGGRRVAVAVGDVAGKGIAAALLMSTVQALLRSQLTSGDKPLTEVVSTMNRLLRGSTGEGDYATFFLAELDEETRGLTYVNAGHNPPLLFRGPAAHGAIPLTTGGTVIGTFLDMPYEQETVRAESGDVLVAYTDGVTEALSPEGVEFGEERLRSAVIQSSHLTARGLAEKVIAEVLEWQAEAPQHDDITLVVARVK